MKIYKTTIILCSLFALMFVVGCASSSNYTRHSRWTSKQFAQNKLPKFDVPVEVNDRVVAWIDYFQGTGRNHFARYLARSGKYIPQMQEILKSYGMPQDLVYLSLLRADSITRRILAPKLSAGGTGEKHRTSTDWMLIFDRRAP